jgi:folate-binding protein YgfZ
MTLLALLPDRGVIEVGGEDRLAFLQGLVSNDVTLAAPDRAVWAALLTPQGKWLADFFIVAEGERLLLDCERGQIEMLVAKLSRYRLRARATVTDRSGELGVAVAWGGDPSADATEWDAYRVSLGLPDGSKDLEADKTVLLEAGFDELNGISWTKGCYMGQELTARTRYRGLLKRRLVQVEIDGPLPAAGTPLMRGGSEVGSMRSGVAGRGLAVLRLEALDGQPLLSGTTRLMPRIPAWMRLPEPAATIG